MTWHLANDDREIHGDFEGRTVQVALVGTTTWTQPDEGKNQRYREFSRANARLMAAAPELLGACEALIGWALMAREVIPHVTGDSLLADVDAARAAIAKTKGEEL